MTNAFSLSGSTGHPPTRRRSRRPYSHGTPATGSTSPPVERSRSFAFATMARRAPVLVVEDMSKRASSAVAAQWLAGKERRRGPAFGNVP
jgi:hypothetical protein